MFLSLSIFINIYLTIITYDNYIILTSSCRAMMRCDIPIVRCAMSRTVKDVLFQCPPPEQRAGPLASVSQCPVMRPPAQLGCIYWYDYNYSGNKCGK